MQSYHMYITIGSMFGGTHFDILGYFLKIW